MRRKKDHKLILFRNLEEKKNYDQSTDKEKKYNIVYHSKNFNHYE